MGTAAPAQAEFRQTCAVAAHRGDWSASTENGMPAMRSAVAQRADYLETDVRLTKDRQLVLMHDARVNRTTNGYGQVANKTLAQIEAMRLNDGSRVPPLRRLLTMAKPTGVHLLIELKAMGGLASFRALADLIRGFGSDRVRITSVHTELLDTLASVAPGIEQGIIATTLLTPAEVAPYDSVLINFNHMTVEWLESMTLPVYAWTLNDEQQWSASHADELAAVITDAPALFLPWRETGCA